MKKGLLLISLFLVMLFISACGNDETATVEGNNSTEGTSGNNTEGTSESTLETNISIGTHQTGTIYHTLGSGVSSVLSETSPLKVSVKTFSGPNSWMPLLNEGELELGMISIVDLGWAYRGEGEYQKSENIRLLVRGNTVPVAGFTVRQDSGIETLSDLKGKKIAANYPGNYIVKQALEAHLASAGMTWDDAQQVPVTNIAEGLNALRENRVDAAFTGSPTGAINLEVDAAIGLKALNWANLTPDKIDAVPTDVLEKIDKLVPGANLTSHKSGFFDEEKLVLEYAIVLAGSTKLSEEGAYEVVKALFENYEKLHPIFPMFKAWTPETMITLNFTAPYHDGAVKYFKEKGLWTEEHEARQQELLGM